MSTSCPAVTGVRTTVARAFACRTFSTGRPLAAEPATQQPARFSFSIAAAVAAFTLAATLAAAFTVAAALTTAILCAFAATTAFTATVFITAVSGSGLRFGRGRRSSILPGRSERRCGSYASRRTQVSHSGHTLVRL